MSEVGATDRSRLLRSKKAELSGIVKSRKRKLREFFAVCDNGSPIPQLDISNPDTPPINSAEAHFLDVTDILQDRLFDESNLPTRRQIRLETSEHNSCIEELSLGNLKLNHTSRRVDKPQCDDVILKKSPVSTFGPRDNVNTCTSLLKNKAWDYKIERLPLQGHNSKSLCEILPKDQKDASKVTGYGTYATNFIVPSKKGKSDVEILVDNRTGITSTSTQDFIKASTSDVQLPKYPQSQPTYLSKLHNDETNSLNSILPQKTLYKQNEPTHVHEERTNQILSSR